jgi:2,3-bisphosphoglycerate-dependent phosphoglycerate mutase
MTTAITVVRHGESELSVRGICNGDPGVACRLAPSGVLQAQELAERLEGEPFDLAVTSEFQRAQQTLAVGLGDRALEQRVDVGLNDLKFGDFEGRPITEYRAWSAEHPAGARPGTNGESRVDAVIRYCRSIRGLQSGGYAGVLVVGHGIPLTYLVRASAGEPFDSVFDPISCAQPYRIAAADLEAGLSRLEAWTAVAVAT